jgi:hypothetical protein
MTSSYNATRSGREIRNVWDATREAAWDNEISGALESIGLVKDQPPGVSPAQYLANPELIAGLSMRTVPEPGETHRLGRCSSTYNASLETAAPTPRKAQTSPSPTCAMRMRFSRRFATASRR